MKLITLTIVRWFHRFIGTPTRNSLWAGTFLLYLFFRYLTSYIQITLLFFPPIQCGSENMREYFSRNRHFIRIPLQSWGIDFIRDKTRVWFMALPAKLSLRKYCTRNFFAPVLIFVTSYIHIVKCIEILVLWELECSWGQYYN